MALVVGTDGVESPAQASSVTPDEAARVPVVLSPRGGLAWSDYFPNVELTTHNGQRVRFYDDLIKGKVVVINFMYTTCTDS
jgi:cytochrome oxidase Cu insertion factor (SCO1/SenC/PrrC family)